MKFVLANAYRESRIRLTNPIIPLWDVLVPAVYLVIFGSSLDRWLGTGAGGTDYPTFFLAAVLAMVTFSVAMNSSYAFFEDMQSGVFHEMLTYPFARRDLLLGKLLSNEVFGVLGALLCIAIGWALLSIPVSFGALPGLMLWTVLGMAGWYFLFAWISVRVRSFNGYHTTTSAMYLLLMFISNLFYPADRLPGWAEWLAWLNPITWQVDLLRYHTYGAGTPRVLQLEAAAFVAFVLLTFWMAARALKNPVD
ncbi:MAG TPA: ABC transporter permease [Terriglobales bacterium]|nr:ABC transporter permease [Terriglobales bacterium]